MKNIKYIAFLLLFSSVSAQTIKETSNDFPKTIVLEGAVLQKNSQLLVKNDTEKTAALQSLLRQADKIVKAKKLYSVMHKSQVPASGDKHDYMSTGPYWWPDPTKPDGLPYIRKDGLRNPEYYKISDSQEMDLVEDDAETLALAYYFTKKDKYAEWASEVIKTWFLNAETKQNPNLNFGQAIPGLNTGRGIGLIETRGLFRVIDAAILIQNSNSWSKDDHLALKKWFSDYLTWLTESPIGKDEADEHNNHGTHYSVQVISYGIFTNRAEIALAEIETFKNRLESQLKPDGSQPFELARTKSWNYTNMNLEGYFIAARLAENCQIDLWHYQTKEGKSIKAALDWLLPYIDSKKKWEYEQIHNIGFDETVRILKTASNEYSNSDYDTLAKKVDVKSYMLPFNQLAF
ncbi:alginate lyase family protein [Flavobacterium sp. WC2509]|uniref:alginate lyase family protein n=1 Tax=Flavobacterium sp. WC2509 TaxID=3461406 RepID=UPI00404476B8